MADTMKYPCSYCGFDMEVPADFIPKDAGEIAEEKYDPKTGAYLVVVKQPYLQCRNCRVGGMMGRKTIKPKNKTRPKNKVVEPAKAEQKKPLPVVKSLPPEGA